MEKRKLVVLAVLDGYGIAPAGPGNAIELAKKPNLDRFMREYPSTLLSSHGKEVGLKDKEPGNSEAGHENMGAGRTVVQDKIEIINSIHDGTFFKNAAFVEALNHARKNKSNIHLMGLLSNGRSGHSDPEHLEALLVFFKKSEFKNVYLHLFTDGRDTPPRSAEQFLHRIQVTMNNLEVGQIATFSGRYYGMDRAHNYGRLEKSYKAMVYGEGERADNAYQAIKSAYARGEDDEFILPTVIKSDTDPETSTKTISDGDALVFFNLRSDRARQITKAFVQPELLNQPGDGHFHYKDFKDLFFVTLAEFGTDLPVIIAYPTRLIVNSLPEYLEKHSDIHQFYISESEKFAHVTYFFHGNNVRALKNEKRIRVDSKSVATFDQDPEMSSAEITSTLVANISQELYNFCLVNYPNADMLGHTGNINATVKSIEHLDFELGRLYDAVKKRNGTLIITADHGNAEEMLDLISKQESHEHSKNPVPFIIVDEKLRNSGTKLRRGNLGDVAPTVLELMGLEKPGEMYGISLFKL